ncbi:polysaccharide biosynthesis tyrosine autokinase [Pseudactinotalea sp. Z1748]|uniref:polysaccharide biosynthesis tyrosine autokinase n=1 Tax=Pseudactinotalea sp. Z1748 TaxID=3413027 RepID=UPI003C7ADC15
MEIGDLLRISQQRWISIVVTGLAVLLVIAATTLLMTPQYTSQTRIFIAVDAGESVSDLAQGSNFAERQMSSYREVVVSPLVLESVIEALDLDKTPEQLAESLTVTVPADTVVLEIAATDADPALARDVANAVGASVSDVIGGLSPDRPDGTESVRATVLSEGTLPSSPSSPNVMRNLALGVVLGALLGGGLAILREVLDTKVRNERDVAGVSSTGILAKVPQDEAASSHRVFVHQEARGPRAEAIRRLRTNLQFVDFSERSRSLVVTSSIKNEGKSTTAINLAVAMADAGSRVVLIDADLRRPSVARYLGLEGKVGLTTVLSGQANVEDVQQPWRNSGLHVLASGQIPPNPSELLGSSNMARLLKILEARYDMIVIDSPPLLPVTDAAVLSRVVGGVVVVAGADTLHKGQLQQSLESLEAVDAHLFGIVLNKIERTARASYYEDYYGEDSGSKPGGRSGKRPSHNPQRARNRRRARPQRAKAGSVR